MFKAIVNSSWAYAVAAAGAALGCAIYNVAKQCLDEIINRQEYDEQEQRYQNAA